MNRSILIYPILLLGIALSFSDKTIAQIRYPTSSTDVVPNVILVQFTDRVTPVGKTTNLPLFDAITNSHGASSIEPAFPFFSESNVSCENKGKLANTYRVYFSKSTPPEILALSLESDANVVYAEPEYYYEISDDASPQDSPNDPVFRDQLKYIERLQLPEAWDIVKGEQGDVVIAILDSGTDWRHEDLISNVWTNSDEIPDNGIDDDNNGFVDDVHGYDFGNGQPYSPSVFIDLRFNDHGTTVASVASGESNNSIGIAGSSWNASYMPIGADCNGRICNTAKGILYAASNGADFINGSYVSMNYDRTSHLAIQCAMEMGALFIAAAGNSSTNNDVSPRDPANHFETLAVSGTQNARDRVVFNYGTKVDIFAPAIDISVAVPNNQYGSVSGTSFASPLVAGIAALVKTRFPHFSPQQIREQLRYTAQSIEQANPDGFRGLLGFGRVNAFTAVQAPVENAIRVTNIERDLNSNDSSPSLIIESESYLGDGTNQSARIEFVDVPPYLKFESSSKSIDFPSGIGTNSVVFPFTYIDDIPYRIRDKMKIVLTHDGGIEETIYQFEARSGETLPVFINDNPFVRYSITSEGNLGYLDRWGNSAGVGISFTQRSPSQIYEAGLVIGTNADQISSSVIGHKIERDQQPIHFHRKPGTIMNVTDADESGNVRTEVVLLDSNAPNPVGVEIVEQTQLVTQEAYPAGGFMIVEYTVTNPLTKPINNLHVGLYADWILSVNWSNDQPRYDAERDVIYQFSEGGSALIDGETVGLKILSDGAESRYGAIPNHGIHPGLSWNEVMWEYLSGGNRVGFPSEDGWSHMASIGPIDLEPGSQRKVAFAIVSGNGDGFFAQVDQAVNFWASETSSKFGNLQMINASQSQLQVRVGESDTMFILESLTSSDYISVPQGLSQLMASHTIGGSNNDPPIISNVEVKSDSNYQVIYYSLNDEVLAVSACCARDVASTKDVVTLRISQNLSHLPLLGLQFMSDQGVLENIQVPSGSSSSYINLPLGVYALEISRNGTPWLSSSVDLQDFGGEALLYTFIDGVLPSIAPFRSQNAPSLPLISFSEIPISTQHSAELPSEFVLHSSYPNPVRSTMHIQFDLPYSAQISINIVDILGKQIRDVFAGQMEAGYGNSIAVDIHGLSSGAYVYRLTAQSDTRVFSGSDKFVIIR